MVTDAELDAASVETAESTVVVATGAEANGSGGITGINKEEVAKETDKESPKELIKEEPDDNKERSNLGRRVKAMEDGLKGIMTKMDQYFTQKSNAPAPDEDEDATYLTKKDVKNLFRDLQTEEQNKFKEYDKNYLTHEATLGMDLSEAEFDEVIQERMKNFNTRLSQNPQADAELNFMKAQNAVLRRKISGKEKPNPLKGKPADAPLGGPSGSRNDTGAEDKPIQLDPAAKEFVEKMGISEESVKKALSGDAPLYLTGKVSAGR